MYLTTLTHCCDPKLVASQLADLRDYYIFRRKWWDSWYTFAYLTPRRDEPRMSTRDMHHAIVMLEGELLDSEAAAHAVEALREADNAAQDACAAVCDDSNAEHERAYIAAAQRVNAARAAALATCSPESLAILDAAYARIEDRFKAARKLRSSRRHRNANTAHLVSAVISRLGLAAAPPGLDTNPEPLTQSAARVLRQVAERLTRTLTLAPGAPSRAVCV